MSGELDRRSLLRLGAACLALTACSNEPARPAAGPTATPPRPPAPSPSPSPTPPAAPRWAPLAAEPLPELKQVAADFVQVLATREAGARPEDALAAADAPLLAGDAALAVAAPLFAEARSRAAVVYPQFGGLAPDGPGAVEACVMVVVRQTLVAGSGATQDQVRTCDVRLTRRSGRWQVAALVSVGGEPVDRPGGLDPLTAAVLDDPRLELPDSARWDVHAGRVAPDVLRVLAAAAARAPLSVAVLRSGHPEQVFGTDRISDHARGRAVDVWAVGGAPVVGQPLGAGPVRAVLEGALADPRVRQAGSPPGTDLDGPGQRRSFVNVVHSDHLHLATGGAPAS